MTSDEELLEQLLAGELSEEQEDEFVTRTLDRPEIVARLQTHLVLEGSADQILEKRSDLNLPATPQGTNAKEGAGHWKIAAAVLFGGVFGALLTTGVQRAGRTATSDIVGNFDPFAAPIVELRSVRSSEVAKGLLRFRRDARLAILKLESPSATFGDADLEVKTSATDAAIMSVTDLSVIADGFYVVVLPTAPLLQQYDNGAREFSLVLSSVEQERGLSQTFQLSIEIVP